MFERLLNPAVGFYPKLGSVTAGSGLAFGAGYRHAFTDRRGVEHVRFGVASGATGRSRPGSSSTTSAGARCSWIVHARGSDYPDEDYFGQGSTSLRTDHVSYGLRQTMAGATTGLNLTRWLSTGVRVDYFNPRIHEGPDTRVPPIGSVFPPGDVPGLVTQPDFANTEVFVEANTASRAATRGAGDGIAPRTSASPTSISTATRSIGSSWTRSSTSRSTRTAGSSRCTGCSRPPIRTRAMTCPSTCSGRWAARTTCAASIGSASATAPPAAAGRVPLGDLHGGRRRALLRHGQGGAHDLEDLDITHFESDCGHRLPVRHRQRRVPARRGGVREQRRQAPRAEVGPCLLARVRRPLSGARARGDRAGGHDRRARRGAEFYPDDPMQVDDDRALDASRACPSKAATATTSPSTRSSSRATGATSAAMNINTIDEVPDSSWFTNRIGRRLLPIDEIVRGPNQLETVDITGWPIVQEKERGHHSRLSHRRSRRPSLPGQVRSAVPSGDGQRRRGDRRRHLPRDRLQRRQGYIVEVDPGEHRHRADRPPPWTCPAAARR